MFSKSYAIFLLTTLGMALYGSTAHAEPKIGTISQVTADQLKLVINGSGFTAKTHAKPLYFLNFEEGQLTQSNYSLVTTPLKTNGTLTSETTPFGNGNSLRYRVINDSHSVAIPGITFNPAPNQLFIFFHRRYNFSISDPETWGPDGLNLKTNRMWSPDNNNIYIGYQGKEGDGSGRIYPEYTATGGSVWTGSKLPQVANQWLQEEIIYKASDIGVKNGRFDLIRNGIPSHDSLFRMRTEGYPSKYNQLYFDQISNGVNDSQNLYIYYDNIYIDDSLHRVYVSEAPTFSEATTRLIQVPTGWSDSTIEVVFNPGDSLPSNLYVYVVDGNGDVNSVGARICEGDCPTPPNPPESIMIN